MKDERYEAIRARLSVFKSHELGRIVENRDILLTDDCNYKDGKYCPLALAMNLHNTIKNPTDSKIKAEIGRFFDPVNIVKGLRGEFYTTNRENDLINLCK